MDPIIAPALPRRQQARDRGLSRGWYRPMAKRPSVKEILEAARRGGAAQPESPAAEPVPVPVEEAPAVEAESAAVEETPAAPAAPAANVPTAASLGRPLSLKEKLAAAR